MAGGFHFGEYLTFFLYLNEYYLSSFNDKMSGSNERYN